MPNYILTDDGKLYHVDDGFLQHWKYIKREKVNGKWRYYYHDTKYEKLKTKSDSKRQQYDELKKGYVNAGTQLGWTYSDVKLATLIPKRQTVRAEYKTSKAEAKYLKAKEKYEKSIGYAIAKCLNKALDAIDKLADKGKDFVDKLFNKKGKKSRANGGR